MLRSAQEFRAACLAYCRHYHSLSVASDFLGPHQLSYGWDWEEVTRLYAPPTGHLLRTFSLISSGYDAEDPAAGDAGSLYSVQENDVATGTSLAPRGQLRMEQSVCWSSTWGTPVIYFNVFEDLRPLTLEETLQTGAVKLRSAEIPDRGSLASFAQLSLGDHPVTGLASLYLHPCETEARLKELRLGQTAEISLVHELDLFMLIADTAIFMRAPELR